MNEINIKKIDWLSLTILSLLVLLGLINIYSATHTDLIENVFSLNHPFGKQCFFAFISVGGSVCFCVSVFRCVSVSKCVSVCLYVFVDVCM
jgi:cell division protein FtsW (lipid II flippase)